MNRILRGLFIFSILFFINSVSADSVWYTDSLNLEGKIVSQNAVDIFLETDDGTLYRIKKSAVKKIKYDQPQKQINNEEKKTAPKPEVLTLSTNSNEKSARVATQSSPQTSTIQTKAEEPLLISNVYYQILKDSRTYLIRLEGENFNKIDKILLENSQKVNEPEIYNLQAKSIEMVLKSNDLELGFYDLVIQSKSGHKIRKEYFVEVKEP